MSRTEISRWVFRLLKWFCPDHLLEEIEGDLIQRYRRDVIAMGEKKAKFILALNTLLFFRPEIIMRNRFSSFNRNFMIRNYTRLTFRQARRSKLVTTINLVGLALAFGVCLLIAQFALFEHSFEEFNENANRTYRVNLYNTQNGVHTSTSSETVPALAYSIKQTIPGIDDIARLSYQARGVVSNPETSLSDREDNIVFADPSIIDILAIEIIEGDKSTALKDGKSILISESIAKKYFGSTDVLGKTLEFGFSNNSLESTPYKISGVFRDTPQNTHRQFQIMLPPANEQSWNENWSWSEVATYLVLPPSVSPGDLERGLAEIVKTHHRDGAGDRYILEPITSIRLHAIDGSGRATLVNFFILLGPAMLLLAWFNYTNLSTARFLERLKEVGVRKLIGGTRLQLITQFLVETFYFTVVAFIVALLSFYISWPHVSGYFGQKIPVTLFDDSGNFLIIGAFIFGSALLSGFYPSLFLSSFKPLPALKGTIEGIADRTMLRKTLVAVQLSVSIGLVTGVIAIQRQVAFMQTQDLGISIERTLMIEEALVTDARSIEKYETVKNEMLRLGGVEGVTNASTFAGREIDWHRTDITLAEEDDSYKYNSRIIAIGPEFLNVFQLGLLAGRNFDPAIESDKKAMLISEDAAKMFGFSHFRQSLGKAIFIGSRKFEVIGVVKNYHHRSLQSRIEPLLFMQSYPRGPNFAIKIGSGRLQETIPQLKSIWEEAYTGNVFRYYLLDEFFDRQYQSENTAADVISVLTVMALFIACSGLFAWSLFSVGRRSKEISIRKIFGATIRQMIMLLTREVFIVMIAAVILIIPMMYYSVNEWLDGYAYKMPLNAWMFLLPVVIVIALVLITISFQTVAAARRNPAENMRHE